ncbi:hypothetical protein B0A52_06107 [Exophiala mesophila]|uniref:Uncharacterized protein n=1 Tax=Exophiala mesophila TaxID=212818 RepID=A0A438N5F4_EXOME|nr:hypothetical protein B0A52_06107 [Exophiala mesophila]
MSPRETDAGPTTMPIFNRQIEDSPTPLPRNRTAVNGDDIGSTLRTSRSSKRSDSTDGGVSLALCPPRFLAPTTTFANHYDADSDTDSKASMSPAAAVIVSRMNAGASATSSEHESSSTKPRLRLALRQEPLRSANASMQDLASQDQESVAALNATRQANQDKHARVDDYNGSEDDLPRGNHVVSHNSREKVTPEQAMREEAMTGEAVSEDPALLEAQMWASIEGRDDDDNAHSEMHDDFQTHIHGRQPATRVGQVVQEIATDEARTIHHCLDILSLAVDNLDSIDNPFSRGRNDAVVARTMIIHLREEVDRITRNNATTMQLLQFQDILSEGFLHRLRWEQRARNRHFDTYGLNPNF